MAQPPPLIREDEALARELILDELFDLTLYRRLYGMATGDTQKLLRSLVTFEERHLLFWQDFFGMRLARLGFARQIKLMAAIFLCQIFKTPAIHLVLEAIEIYGIRKYLNVWESYEGKPLGKAVENILHDELEHEDVIVSKFIDRAISPERVRSIFLGFNDGLVEILGAVSGFFAAFDSHGAILAAGFTVAVAGSVSMGAGAYVAGSSEEEVCRTEDGKEQFLSGMRKRTFVKNRAFANARVVGVSYFIGSMVPLLPVAFNGENFFLSIVSSLIMVILVSSLLAFLSGMEIRKRIATNMVIIALAVGISYVIGIAAREVFGVAL